MSNVCIIIPEQHPRMIALHINTNIKPMGFWYKMSSGLNNTRGYSHNSSIRNNISSLKKSDLDIEPNRNNNIGVKIETKLPMKQAFMYFIDISFEFITQTQQVQYFKICDYFEPYKIISLVYILKDQL